MKRFIAVRHGYPEFPDAVGKPPCKLPVFDLRPMQDRMS